MLKFRNLSKNLQKIFLTKKLLLLILALASWDILLRRLKNQTSRVAGWGVEPRLPTFLEILY